MQKTFDNRKTKDYNSKRKNEMDGENKKIQNPPPKEKQQ